MFGRFPGANGATRGLTCDGRRVPLRPAAQLPARPPPFVRGRPSRDQWWTDELLQRARWRRGPVGLRAVPPQGHPELLGLRASLRPSRSLLLLHVRPDRHRAPVHDRRHERPVHRPRTGASARASSGGTASRGSTAATERSARGRSASWTPRNARTRIGLEERRARGRAPEALLVPAMAVHRRARSSPTSWRSDGISWKYYLGDNEYVHTIDWIRHARTGPMRRKVVDDAEILRDLEARFASGRVLADPRP